MFDDFSLDGIGLTVDDLNLADFADDLGDDLPVFATRRPWRPRGWWTTTEAESIELDYPDFQDGHQRVRYLINQMARTALAMIPGATADDALFPYQGGMLSLNELMMQLDQDTVVDMLDKYS